MAGAYATAADLAAWLGGYPPANAAPLLARATDDIDSALVGAHYNVDADGFPTDTAVIEALRDATCAQAVWRTPTADQQRLNPAAVTSPGLCPEAANKLQLAGLLPIRPRLHG